jgi:hypothetical protein
MCPVSMTLRPASNSGDVLIQRLVALSSRNVICERARRCADEKNAIQRGTICENESGDGVRGVRL